MGAAFGWIGELIDWIADLIPRFEIVRKTHQGVAFVRGKHVKHIGPGLVWWWPFWTELEIYPVVRQTLNLEAQKLTTKDDKTVVAGAIIVYTIHDIVKAMTEQWDLPDTIDDLSSAAVCDFVTSNDFAWINTNRAVVKRHLTQVVAEALDEYGVTVVAARLTDFAQAKVIALVGEGAAVLENDGEEYE